jgi:8-oxo-dGTP diphosphatase
MGTRLSGDGNGWVICDLGHRHWGLFGAAGILITDGARVVLQHRAVWTHEGGTWALPGGARDSHEDAIAAAMREAVEETTLDPAHVTPYGEWIDEHGGWSYTTVLAHAAAPVELEPANGESVAIGWWPVDEVATLELHSGFAAAWPHLRELIRPV